MQDVKIYGFLLTFQGFKRKLIIGLIYRHPNSDSQVFIEALNKRISNLNLKKSDLYLMRDMNLNLLREKMTASGIEYLSMLANHGLFPLITKPTRITANSATVIDHIFTSAISYPTYPGILLHVISDHFYIYLR